MINLLKKNFAIVLAVVLCLSLTACIDIGGTNNGGNDDYPDEVGGTDWRTTGVWRADGTITRDGVDTNVLVCVNKEDATFYYDEIDQTLYSYVEYPIVLEGDPWETFLGIEFADLNGDSNSDVTMWFSDGDGNDAIQMVWYWDTDLLQYVLQWDESQLGDYSAEDFEETEEYIEEDTEDGGYYSWDSELCQRNVSEFEGVWYYDEDLSASTYIIIDSEGNWSYYERAEGDPEGTEMDHGTFSYSADEVSTYYADSAVYDDLSIRVFEFDEGVLVWGEDTYYRME